MDTLVSLGTAAAWTWSAVAVVAGEGHLYTETAAVVTTFLLFGRWAEARSKRRAGDALRSLMELGAKQVSVLRDGVEEQVPVETLVVGDRFVVRPGEKVATDGVVEEGASAVDLSLLTGESVPVEVGPGDEVVGASLNTSGRLVVRATRVGGDTQLAQIARLVEPRPAEQGTHRATGRPRLGGLRTGGPGDRACSPCWAGSRSAVPRPRPSPPPWRSSSSPAPAPSGWRRPPPSWSAPAAAPSSAS